MTYQEACRLQCDWKLKPLLPYGWPAVLWHGFFKEGDIVRHKRKGYLGVVLDTFPASTYPGEILIGQQMRGFTSGYIESPDSYDLVWRENSEV